MSLRPGLQAQCRHDAEAPTKGCPLHLGPKSPSRIQWNQANTQEPIGFEAIKQTLVYNLWEQ